MQLFNRHSFDKNHTPAEPYCDSKPDCWCHTDIKYHDKVQHPERRNNRNDADLARSILFGQGGEPLYIESVHTEKDKDGKDIDIVTYGVARRQGGAR